MSSLRMARVAILEGRLGSELASLVRRHGGVPYYAPAVREASMECGQQVAAFIGDLVAGSLPIVVFLTGAGAKALFQEAEKLGRGRELLRGLQGTSTVCRGPKPAVVLKRSGVAVTVTAREPSTTAELLEAMAGLEVMGRGVALVQYGERNAVLAETLRARGARVEELCLYEWLLPEDVGPLMALVRDIVGGRVDAVAFTSQVQARHLFQVAATLGQTLELAAGLNNHTTVASIGPVCTAALRRFGVEPQVVPEHPKMGHLIVALAQHQEERGLRSGKLFATVA